MQFPETLWESVERERRDRELRKKQEKRDREIKTLARNIKRLYDSLERLVEADQEKKMPKYKYKYEHRGYIAEDHHHVATGDEGEVNAKNLKEAIIKAMIERLDGDPCDQAWVDEHCEVSIKKNKTSAVVVWSWHDIEGNGRTDMTVTLVKGKGKNG